jgi:hypothetical protein
MHGTLSSRPGAVPKAPTTIDMDMLDTIRNDETATEAAGRLAPSTVAALVEAGSFKLWVPEDYSGGGTSL